MSSVNYSGEEFDGDDVPVLIIPAVTSQLPENDGNLVNNDNDELINYISTDSSSSTGSSWYASVFLVVNAALGAGLLDFPQAFSKAGGVICAIIVQIVLLFFAVIALVILAYCARSHNSKTYQDVIASICGKKAQRVCSVIVALYCYGTCVTFIIVIGDQLDRIFASMYGGHFCHVWYLNRYATTSFSCVFILLMCFSKKIDFLKIPSYLGVFAVMYVDFVIIYQYYKGNYTPGTIKTQPNYWSDVFFVVPVICFGYQCHVSCVPVYSCMKDKRVTNFLKTIIVAIVICAFTYTVAATYGYLTFGSNVQSDILYMYNAKDPVVLAGMLALAAKTLTTYPILQFCGRAAIDDLYVDCNKMTILEAQGTEQKRRIVTTLIWFFSSLLLALVIPNIGDVIEVLGSLAAVFIFIFPGACLMVETLEKDRYFLRTLSQIKVYFAVIFIAIGVLIFVLTIGQSIEDYINPNIVVDIKLCT